MRTSSLKEGATLPMITITVTVVVIVIVVIVIIIIAARTRKKFLTDQQWLIFADKRLADKRPAGAYLLMIILMLSIMVIIL